MKEGKALTEATVDTEWLNTYCNVSRCYGFGQRGGSRRAGRRVSVVNLSFEEGIWQSAERRMANDER